MKFPRIVNPFASISRPEDDAPPAVKRTSTIQMVQLRSRLTLSNARPPDDLSPMVAHTIRLIDKYQATPDPTEKLLILGHLFYATHASVVAMEPARPAPVIPQPLSRQRSNALGGETSGLQLVQRRQALRELFAAVAGLLCDRFDTTVNVLPRFLEDRFGVEISDHGISLDSKHLRRDSTYFGKMAPVAYLEGVERSKYRAVLRQGRAYVLKSVGGIAQEVPLDTRQSAIGDYRGRHRFYAWGFVLSMTRELYVANHSEGAKAQDAQFFHSSYLSGENVLSAGDCIFENGYLRSITNLSGHYQPPSASLVHVIELFKTHGADISNVLVAGIDEGASSSLLMEWSQPEVFAEEAMTAPAFLAAQHDWTGLRVPRTRRGNVTPFRNLVHNSR